MRKGKPVLSYFKKGYEPRRQQREFLEWIDPWLRNSKDTLPVVAEKPVAVGKSFDAGCIADWGEDNNLTTAIVTGSVLLQHQYNRDFPDMACLMGASNYQCVCDPARTCEETRNMNKIRKAAGHIVVECSQCPYKIARARALEEYQCIFNSMSYMYFPRQYLEPGKDGKERKKNITNILIVDEFQMLPGMLSQLFELKIWDHDINFPKGTSATLPAVVEVLQTRLEIIQSILSGDVSKLRKQEITALMFQYDKINTVLYGLKKCYQEFVIEENTLPYRNEQRRCLHIRCIRPLPFITKNFFKADKIILMSATCVESDIRDLGFTEYHKFECDSPIPVDQRRIYYNPVAKNTQKNQEVAIPLIAREIRNIVFNLHPKERGVVLCTYSQAMLLRQYLTEPIFLFHDKSDKKDVIDYFIKHINSRYVAVLAGSFEGLDLKGDVARFNILCKIPLPNIMDEVVKRRMELDKMSPEPLNWYEMQAMKLIVQGVGRTSRHETDSSSIYILDSLFDRVYACTKKYLPKSFKEAITRIKR